MLDPRRLQVLREVARRGSFSAAADAIGYTQSAVSQQVAALERELGVPLLDRHRGVRPTGAGEVLLRHADVILARIADAEGEIAALRGGEAGPLRMVAFPSAGATLLPPAIARFRALHPGVELTLAPMEVPDGRAAIETGACDLALLVEDPEEGAEGGWAGSPSEGDSFARTHLLDDRMNVMLPAGHPLAARRRIRLEELREDPWILGRRDYVPDEVVFYRACRRAGFEPQMAFESDDYLAIQGFVAAGVGVALIPDMALLSVREDVVVRDLVRPPHRRVVAAVDADAWRSPAVDAMLALVVEAGRALAASSAAQRQARRRARGAAAGGRGPVAGPGGVVGRGAIRAVDAAEGRRLQGVPRAGSGRRRACEHVFVSSVICVHLARFPLVVAADGRRELLTRPVALAPEVGRIQVIGEVSPAAEAAGVRRGLSLGEALSRCPQLQLLPPDPVVAQARWDELVDRLEGIGAAVEDGAEGRDGRPGTAWFAAAGIRRLHGGSLDGIVSAVREALGLPVRIGAAPTRFLARVAAGRARTRRPVVLGEADGLGFLRDEPIAALGLRPELAPLVAAFERLGVATLGELVALPAGTVGERFGRPGLRAHALLRGEEEPLRPRDSRSRIEADLLLPEAVSGEQLGHALGLLIDRILAHPQRHHRPLRSFLLQATLVERGTWQERVVLREAMSDPQRIRLALGLRLALLPSPAERLALRVDGFGTPVPADRPLLEEAAAIRHARLREAVRQVREVAGPDGALRVVAIDPGSRVAERQMALTPFEP